MNSSTEGGKKGGCPSWAIPHLPLCWLQGLSPESTGTFPSSRRNLCNACPPWSPISWSLWHECGLFPQSYRPAESGVSPSPLFAAPKDGRKLLAYLYYHGPSLQPSLLLHGSHRYPRARLPPSISQCCHLLAGRAWANYWNPLCLSSFICKIGIIIGSIL